MVARGLALQAPTLTLNSDNITSTGGTVADGITITYSTENMSNPKTVTTVPNPVFIYNGKYFFCCFNIKNRSF